ncbi:MAG TPA: hypothetical protein VKV05_02080, partial [Terriglobales bacterium]|nr:hypothetical protein [Terriglobales bacterium]
MKIALFTPWQPQRTGVAEYSRVLLPSLLELAEVDLWLSHTPAAEAAPCPIVDYRAAPQRLGDLAGYDAVIYQMGNSPVHQPVLEVMLNHPGVVVMHDYVLHHLLASYHLERLHDCDGYLREVRYNCGPAGEAMARAALAGQRPPLWEDPLIPALNYRVLDHTQGVIVHSAYARRLITDSHPHLPVVKLELPVPEAQIPDRTALKLRHGLPSERPVVAVFGFP